MEAGKIIHKFLRCFVCMFVFSAFIGDVVYAENQVISKGYHHKREYRRKKKKAKRPQVRSFDVFDTLVARIHKDPTSVFDLVENGFPFPNFKKLRMEAEAQCRGSLDQIYQKFMELTGIDEGTAQSLRAYEFNCEKQNLFAIQKNISKVRDGDILITDTYYTKEEIAELLRSVGLNKRVEIFASYGGKYSGAIWPVVESRYSIVEHLGDNLHSDIRSAKRHKITAKHTNESEYTRQEALLAQFNQSGIANLMRYLRLRNPYNEKTTKHRIWEEQSQYNVPILVLASLYVNDYSLANNKTRVLFSSRDCCHWIKIFSKMFPQYESVYFHTSRHLYRNPTPSYIEYVNSLYDEHTLLVDSQGTGVSSTTFFKNYLQTDVDSIFIVIAGGRGKAMAYNMGHSIELVNYALEGTLVGFENGLPIRANPEYELRKVRPAHKCIDMAVLTLPLFEYTTYNDELMKKLLKRLGRHTSVLHETVRHQDEHIPPSRRK